MPGASEPRLAQRMPAIAVPWEQASLRVSRQAPSWSDLTVLMEEPEKAGWPKSTGPSITPITIDGAPVVESIRPVRFTRASGEPLMGTEEVPTVLLWPSPASL